MNRDNDHLSDLSVDFAEAAFGDVAVHRFIRGVRWCSKVLMKARSNDAAYEEHVPGKSSWAVVVPAIGSSR